MLRWLQYLQVLPSLIALVREVSELIRHAEDLLAGDGRGAEKKALVLNILDTTVGIGQKLGIPEAENVNRDQMRQVAGDLIDTLVGVLNTTGVFKHGPA